MATKQVILSDISGTELDDINHVKAIVTYPDVGFPVELDLSATEAEQLQNTNLRLAQFELHAPNAPVRRVQVETKVLDKVFSKVDWNDVIAGAKKATTTESLTRRTGTATRKANAAASSEKRDYSSPQWAGVEHRGRTTEAEAEWVRNNMAAANANREREGQEPIDPNDVKMKKRYGL